MARSSCSQCGSDITCSSLAVTITDKSSQLVTIQSARALPNNVFLASGWMNADVSVVWRAKTPLPVDSSYSTPTVTAKINFGSSWSLLDVSSSQWQDDKFFLYSSLNAAISMDTGSKFVLLTANEGIKANTDYKLLGCQLFNTPTTLTGKETHAITGETWWGTGKAADLAKTPSSTLNNSEYVELTAAAIAGGSKAMEVTLFPNVKGEKALHTFTFTYKPSGVDDPIEVGQMIVIRFDAIKYDYYLGVGTPKFAGDTDADGEPRFYTDCMITIDGGSILTSASC